MYYRKEEEMRSDEISLCTEMLSVQETCERVRGFEVHAQNFPWWILYILCIEIFCCLNYLSGRNTIAITSHFNRPVYIFLGLSLVSHFPCGRTCCSHKEINFKTGNGKLGTRGSENIACQSYVNFILVKVLCK